MDSSRHNSATVDIPDGIRLVDIMAFLEENDAASNMSKRYRRRTLDTLLDAIEIPSHALEIDHAIWAHESSHRATNIIRLILHANREDKLSKRRLAATASDREYINKLAMMYRSLHNLDQRTAIACGPAIKEMVAALLVLFGSSATPISCSFQIAHLALPASQFRALILIISEFTMRVLANCSRRSCDGHLSISIGPIENDIVKAAIQTHIGLFEHFMSPSLEVVSGLAGVLSSELTFRETKDVGTVAEFQFNLVRERRVGKFIR